MDLKINGIEDLQRIGREHPKAAARALNRTMKHARTQMKRDASKRYKAKGSDIDKAMGTAKLATAKNLSTYFRSKGKRIALPFFMTAATVSRSLAQGGKKIRARGRVVFEITRGMKRKLPYAFVASMESGHVGVFTRINAKMKSDPKKQAIEERTGPAVPQMLSGAFSRMTDLHEFLRKQLAHEIEWFMKGKGGPM